MPVRLLSEQLQRNPRFLAALEQLLRAREGAAVLGLDVWEFALEIEGLLSAGCTLTELRLLVGAGYAAQAAEACAADNRRRGFEPEHPLRFGPRSCFVLTEAGARFVSAALNTAWQRPSAEAARPGPPGESQAAPFWDAAARELWACDRLLKRFARPAPLLELLLSAFQECDWPRHLDDPLPPAPEMVPQERLRDAVRRLNRCQNPRRIAFASDGLGAGVRWDWTNEPWAETTHGWHTDTTL